MFLRELIDRHHDRPWWNLLVALAYFAVGLLLYAFGFELVFSDWPKSPLWLHLILFTGMCAAQSLRGRSPLGALSAAVVFALLDISIGLTVPVVLVLIDLLFNATSRTPKRTSRRIVRSVVLLVAVLGVTVGVVEDNWRMAFLVTINGFSLLIVPVWWASNVRQAWEIAAAERENSRQLRRINELDRSAAVLAERGRMARDLHDVIAGHLSAIAIQSEALLSIADGDPELVRKVLKSVRENSIQSLDEMRAMIDVLRTEGGEEDPRTAPARLAELDRLVDSARAGGLEVGTEFRGLDGLPVAVDLAAYRIVQEALTNVLKHAAGSVTKVLVSAEGEALVVRITNSLTGEPGGGAGTGLVNMRERAHAVGGSFDAGPWAGGWRVRAVLPTGGVAS
ncbi:MAG: histidine kinase [Kibdelosporangium sp.]